MLSSHLAVATRGFLLPLRQSLLTAAKIGANGVQFDVKTELNPAELSETGIRQLLHYTKELNLKVASLSFASRRPLYELDRLDDRLNAVRQAMKLAYQMQTRLLTVRIGRIPGNKDSREFQTLSEILNDLAAYGNQVGTSLLITPSGDTAETLLDTISGVTQGPIGINFDPAVFVLSGQSPLEALRILHSVFKHVQLRDAVKDIDGNGLEVPLGDGEVKWAELLALLEEAGYRDWLTLDRTQGDDKSGDLARGIKRLRSIVPG